MRGDQKAWVLGRSWELGRGEIVQSDTEGSGRYERQVWGQPSPFSGLKSGGCWGRRWGLGGMEDAQTGETPCRCRNTLVCRAGQGKQGDGRRQRQGVVCEEVRKGAWPRWGKEGFPFLQKGGNRAGKEGEGGGRRGRGERRGEKGEGGRERGEGEEKGRAKGDLK